MLRRALSHVSLLRALFIPDKSTFHNGREDASALVKYALLSIKGRVKLDFHCLPQEKFVRTWVDPGFCVIHSDFLVFCF